MSPIDKKQPILEREIEAWLREACRARGWECYKWVSPGNVGVPDRIMILPGGRVVFVELKQEGARLGRLQEHQHMRLRRQGCEVVTVHGIIETRALVARLQHETSKRKEAGHGV